MNVSRRALDIGLFGVLLLVGVFVVRSWQGPDEGYGTRRPEGKSERPPRPETPAPPVDLLDLIDVRRDTVAGSWRKEGKSLVTSAVPFGRLEIPYVPPREYDLRLVVERHGGEDSLNAGLVREGLQFAVIIDGMKTGDTTGLDIIDGKGFMENASTWRGKLLPLGQRRTVVYSVRDGRVTVSVEGKAVISWEAKYDVLSLYHEWKVGRPDVLFIGSYASEFRIDEMILTPRSLGGRLLR